MPAEPLEQRRIRVLIADDEPFLRRGLRGYLDEAADIEVVAEAGNGQEAVRFARATHADVVLMDLRMPGGSGIDAIHELSRTDRRTPIAVVAITTFDTDENIFGAIEHGARAVMLKSTDPSDLVAAVRAVARGEGYLAAPLVPRVLNEFRRRRVPSLPGQTLAQTKLTPREVHLLHGLTLGMSNEELAELLQVSVGTVKSLLNSIKVKLNLEQRRHVIVWAFNNGLHLSGDLVNLP